MEYKGFSTGVYFTQVTIISEAQPEEGGFPAGVVSLQLKSELLCKQKVS